MDSAGRISYKPELMFCNGIKISNRGIKCVHRTKHSLNGLNPFFCSYIDQGKEVFQDDAC